MATSPPVRPAALDDVAGMADALARAFHDDPVMAWLFGPETEATVALMRRYFAHEGKRHLRHPTVLTVDGRDGAASILGAAYWDPPKQWKTRLADVIGMAPFMVRAMGRRIPVALRGLGIIEAAHGRQDPEHYYLAVLGTRPDQQGSGIGSALMAPMLERCDTDGVGAYLESSKAENIPFYERHGFKVVEELTLPTGRRQPKGPGLWPMWRDPQPLVG